MNLKKGIALALTAAALLAFTGCGSNGTTSNGEYKVGVVQLVEHPALDAANKGFVDALKEKGLAEKITFDQQNRFVSDRKNLILAIATPAAQSMANATHDIPILGTAITDYEAAKLVKSNQKPGGNVSGTSDMNPVEQQVDLILQVMPNAKTIGTIYSSSEVNSQIQVEKMKAYAATKGIKVEEVTVSNVNDIQQAAQNLVSQRVDAVYVPTDNVVASAMSNLVAITDPAKIPVFGGEDNHVKGGAVMSLSVDYYKLGYQTGLMAAKILTGEAKVEDMPIEMQKEFKLVVGKDKLEKLGITLPEDLMNKATMI
ncbi:ABC transporter substrate-binding protein [Veillonella sp.]|uniref:ABC transporter substrate-binding protein n=1 Tax=Veillonella sp. TaxID=1926307 RepID=UPI0029113455|nr:ABC transporter substrate-binding protein [Veillonella sp.]MDU3481968.1 ABC transporter substrate-binding protein [Veillonella sp.]